MWRQQGRHKTGTTGSISLNPTQPWMGNITEWSVYGYVEATRKAQDSNYWWHLIASDPAMDGEHNRVVRVWLCGGNKEDTRQPRTTGGNSSHPTQQWMGSITEWSGYGYVEATRKAQDRNYGRQLIAYDPSMNGEHDRVVRVWLYVEATRKAQDRNYGRQLIAYDPSMNGEHDRVVRVWLCGGNKEGTGQELLATTHCIRPSNGWGT